MDFLKNYFDKETVEEIEKKYSKEILYNILYNKQNIIDVINYFKELKINNIDELALNNISIFTTNINDLKTNFNKYNQKELSNFINNDINNIELIWN